MWSDYQTVVCASLFLCVIFQIVNSKWKSIKWSMCSGFTSWEYTITWSIEGNLLARELKWRWPMLVSFRDYGVCWYFGSNHHLTLAVYFVSHIDYHICDMSSTSLRNFEFPLYFPKLSSERPFVHNVTCFLMLLVGHPNCPNSESLWVIWSSWWPLWNSNGSLRFLALWLPFFRHGW